MWKDPIVEEIRKIREKQVKRFNFDVRAICEDAQKRQAKSGHRVVSFIKKKSV